MVSTKKNETITEYSMVKITPCCTRQNRIDIKHPIIRHVSSLGGFILFHHVLSIPTGQISSMSVVSTLNKPTTNHKPSLRYWLHVTLPETNIAAWKYSIPKGDFIFQRNNWAIRRGHIANRTTWDALWGFTLAISEVLAGIKQFPETHVQTSNTHRTLKDLPKKNEASLKGLLTTFLGCGNVVPLDSQWNNHETCFVKQTIKTRS